MSTDAVDPIKNSDLASLIRELRAEVLGLAGRVAVLEQAAAAAAAATPPSAAASRSTQDTATPAAPDVAHTAPPAAPTTTRAVPTEEDLLVIAAAVAAYLGVRARIRQVRLIQSTAWAQVGRATVHASHRVH